MVAHSTPKAGVEWGTQSLGCRCREDWSFLSRLASASGLLEMTNLFDVNCLIIQWAGAREWLNKFIISTGAHPDFLPRSTRRDHVCGFH